MNTPCPPPNDGAFSAYEVTELVGPDDKLQHTKRRETDAHTALTRGLEECLNTLDVEWFDGNRVKFSAVYSDWPDASDRASYPAVLVREDPSGGGGIYGGAPIGASNYGDPFEDGSSLVAVNALRLPITLDIRCATKEERIRTLAAVEDLFSASEAYAGLRLRLPHYHRTHATFELAGVTYPDDTDNIARGYFNAVVSIVGEVPVLRMRGVVPRIQLQTRVVTTSQDGSETES